ncbi:MAG: flagellar basal body rod protein FlgB [Clostridiales bacterium]|nr:flagellar basal body rod protein FlgB [Clostridiales bacterium]
MVFDKMYNQFNILSAAINASSVRNEVIVSNLANNDVPDYKAKAVDFEESLEAAISRYRDTGELDLSEAKPSVRFVDQNYDYRIDENNVDVELEMTRLYQNSIRYETMIQCLTINSKRMSMVLTGR